MDAEPSRPLGPYALLSVLAALIAVIAAAPGLLVSGTYEGFVEPLHLAESRGQDLTTLVVGVPLLLVGMRHGLRGSARGLLAWAGAAGYLLYVNLIYAYGGVYNPLFFAYVAVCGLSLFTLIGLLGSLDLSALAPGSRLPVRLTAAYFLGTAVLLTLMWGAMAVQSIAAAEVADATVIIVTDLVVIIPALVMAAIWLLRGRPWGVALSGVLFAQTITLGLSIVAGQVIGLMSGLELSWGLAGFFAVFTAVGLALGIPFFWHLPGVVSRAGGRA